jgi:penicillin-binding protein 1A
VPPGIKLISVDAHSGMRAGGPGSILEAFKPGTAPPDSYAAGDGGGDSPRANAAPDDSRVGSGTGGLY